MQTVSAQHEALTCTTAFHDTTVVLANTLQKSNNLQKKQPPYCNTHVHVKIFHVTLTYIVCLYNISSVLHALKGCIHTCTPIEGLIKGTTACT